jgi:hypothetical protein
MNNNTILKKWLQEGIIKECLNQEIRLEQEKKELQKLKQRNGYLAEYDSGIRYMHMYLLCNGYDLGKISVHYAFRKFLQEFIKVQAKNAKEIISERHKLKYENSFVSTLLVNELKLLNLKMLELLG